MACDETPCPRSHCTGRFVPRTSVGSCPLKSLETPYRSSRFTSGLVPWTSVGSCPLQNVEMPCLRSRRARLFVPWAASSSRPFQEASTPVPRSLSARSFISLLLAKEHLSAFSLAMAQHSAGVRSRPHSKLYDSWDIDVEAITAIVTAGRLPQIHIQSAATGAKNGYWLSGTNPATPEVMSAFTLSGLSMGDLLLSG